MHNLVLNYVHNITSVAISMTVFHGLVVQEQEGHAIN